MFGIAKKNHQRDARFQQVLAFVGQDHFSTIPSMLSRIQQITADPDSSIMDYVRVCEMDQSACIRILRAANSAAFGVHNGDVIRTMKDAVIRLGAKRTCEILTGTVVSPLFKHGEPIAHYSPSQVWLNSVAVATTNRIIYQLLKLTPAPDSDPYLVGLLHNMAIPIEHLCFFEEGFRSAIEAQAQNATPLVEEENRFLHFNHTELGNFLAQNWQLPEAIGHVIQLHHEPGEQESNSAITLTHVTRASQWLCLELQLGYSEFSENQADFYLPSFIALGISADLYARLQQEVMREIERWTKIGWFSDLRMQHHAA